MYETLLRLWEEGKMTQEGLENAASKGWITEEQKQGIMSA